MFTYKTDAQLEAMTAVERDNYATEKRAHEANETKKATELAVSEAIEIAKKEFKADLKIVSDDLATATKANNDLEEVVIKQGEELKKKGNGSQPNTQKAEELDVELKALFKDGDIGTLKQKTRLKAFTADDAISVADFPNVAGTGTIAGAVALIRNFFVQLIPGVFGKPIAKSNILDYVDLLPMSGDRLVSISETELVNISVSPEGTVKPVSKMTAAPLSKDAKVASTLWKSTTQMLKFYPIYLQFFFDRLTQLFDKEIPRLVILEIQANTTAFTPVPSQIFLPAPNNYDAIVACIASEIKMGYVPNACFISPFAFENMKGLRGLDDHYLLANNGSINLLDGTINFGKIAVAIEIDVELADDKFMVGDFKSVKVAIDNNLDYVEAHVGEDFSLNMKSHRLEKFYAVNIPEGIKTGIICDTFTNVKALITKL